MRSLLFKNIFRQISPLNELVKLIKTIVIILFDDLLLMFSFSGTGEAIYFLYWSSHIFDKILDYINILSEKLKKLVQFIFKFESDMNWESFVTKYSWHKVWKLLWQLFPSLFLKIIARCIKTKWISNFSTLQKGFIQNWIVKVTLYDSITIVWIYITFGAL